MRSPTLIPDGGVYGIAILVAYGLSCFFLAAYIHSRINPLGGIPFYSVYAGAMALTILWGFLIFDIPEILGTSWIAWIAAVPVGLAAGWAAGRGDRAILRYLLRRSLLQGKRAGGKLARTRQTERGMDLQARSTYKPTMTRSTRRRFAGLGKQQEWLRAMEDPKLEHGLILLVAALEEVIYRGLLLRTCFLLPGKVFPWIAVAGLLTAFSLSHIRFGWPQVLAKLPLGVLATISALCLGTVLPAMVAHMVFNEGIWRDRKNQIEFARPKTASQIT